MPHAYIHCPPNQGKARICNTVLTVVTTAGATFFLIMLYTVFRILILREGGRFWIEALLMMPVIMAANASPAVVLSAIGFGRLAKRFYYKRNLTQSLEP
jgi:hypothetical protein